MVFQYATKELFNQCGGATQGNFFFLFVLSLFMLAINAMLVFWSYNRVMPKVLGNNFRPLNFTEAIFLVILANTLLN